MLRYPRGDLTKLQNVGLAEARNIAITTDDGILLKGYHIMPPGPISQHALSLKDSQRNDYFNEKLTQSERIIIYFHGNGGTRALSFRVNKVKALAAQLSAHVITIDYRGFADSTGKPSEDGTFLDSVAVLKWINNIILEQNHFGYLIQATNECQGLRPPPHLYIYGHSLGTAIGTNLAMQMTKIAPGSLSGLILDAAFTTLTEAAFSHPITLIFRIIPGTTKLIKRYLHYKYPTIERIGSIDTNLLLLHGINDWKIPVEHSRKLYKIAKQNQFSQTNKQKNIIRLKEIPGADHNDVYKSAEWLEEIPQFIKSVENDFKDNKTNKRCNNPSK
jgi:pimeloyl-ACP methyl ester carboxylesterase